MTTLKLWGVASGTAQSDVQPQNTAFTEPLCARVGRVGSEDMLLSCAVSTKTTCKLLLRGLNIQKGSWAARHSALCKDFL